MVKMCAAAKSPSFQIVVAIAVAAVLLTTATILICHFINKPEKEDVFYPDLVSVPASSCWEANVFATSKDPYYKWVTGTSIPSLLSKLSSSKFSMAVYAAAYQKMSVWRVSREKDVSGQEEGVLYTAPDPRLMGGVILQHAKSWIWKMHVHWGIGIRRCLNEAIDGQSIPVESCEVTAPVIPIFNSTATATRPALASLHVQVPFNDFSSGYYLTNFASSAKSNISLGVGRRKVDANDSTSTAWYYFQDDIKECEQRFPVYYLPDVVSDYAGPLYQCGCISPAATSGAAACIISKNLTSIASVLHLGQGCNTSLSFWDTQVDLGENRTMLQTNSPLCNRSFAITTQFNKLQVADAFNSSNIKLVAQGLVNITECVESWLKSFSREPPTDEDLGKLPAACHHDMINIIESKRLKIFGLDRDVDSIVKRLLTEDQNEAKLDCGLQSKLAQGPLCYRKLNSEAKDGIHTLLKDVLALAQVTHYGQKLWKDESQKRSQVYLALLTSLMGLFGAMVGMLSRTITDVENAVLCNAPRYVPVFVPQSPFHRSLLRTAVRIFILMGSVVALLISLFFSMKDIRKEPEAATSETILHFGKNGAFLVTTTSTVEVEPNWIVYVIFTALVALTLVPFSIVVFFKVSNDEETSNSKAPELVPVVVFKGQVD